MICIQINAAAQACTMICQSFVDFLTVCQNSMNHGILILVCKIRKRSSLLSWCMFSPQPTKKAKTTLLLRQAN